MSSLYATWHGYVVRRLPIVVCIAVFCLCWPVLSDTMSNIHKLTHELHSLLLAMMEPLQPELSRVR